MNKETKYCLDGMGRKAGEKVGLINCHNMGGNQVIFKMNYNVMIFLWLSQKSISKCWLQFISVTYIIQCEKNYTIKAQKSHAMLIWLFTLAYVFRWH